MEWEMKEQRDGVGDERAERRVGDERAERRSGR